MDPFTFVMLSLVIALGLYGNMMWLSVIGGLLLVGYMFGKRTETIPVPTGGPKIKPIIIKRRYDGPPSIYPSLMKIRVNPNWNTWKWWENAVGAAGTGTGLGLAALRGRL